MIKKNTFKHTPIYIHSAEDMDTVEIIGENGLTTFRDLSYLLSTEILEFKS